LYYLRVAADFKRPSGLRIKQMSVRFTALSVLGQAMSNSTWMPRSSVSSLAA
jgi:hypothetical protein